MTVPRFIVVLLICVSIVLFIDDRCGHAVKTLEDGARTVAEVVTTTTITYTQIRSIVLWYAETLSELETAEHEDWVTVEYEILNERWAILKDIHTTAEMSMSGKTAAGSAVTGLRLTADSANTFVHVYLEEPKITGFYMNRVHSFEYPGSVWQTHGERTSATTDSYFQCIMLAQDVIQQNALDSGLLERARENIEAYFRELEEIPCGTGGITVVFHWGEEPPVNNPEAITTSYR